MERDFVVKEQTKHLIHVMRIYERKRNGHLEFKHDLETELSNFYDPIDKLTFLYEINKSIKERMEEHLPDCDYKDKPENCFIHSFCIKSLFFLEQEIGTLNPDYAFNFLRPNLNSDLLKDNLILLKDYPEAGRIYQSALNKLNEGKNERNLLDDLRLSLEILLKKLLANNKSLENQTNEIGSFLKSKYISGEVRNMFIKLIDYYSKYQNNYIKHNNLVIRAEIDLIVNLTGAFINFLINK
ncbi:MAG TPA: hypothetical protein VIK14_13225 [Ignavibacteria bacterium]